jgi:hypothetical protein
MSQFHSLTVKQVRNETRDAVSILFDVPRELGETFRFTPGPVPGAAHPSG